MRAWINTVSLEHVQRGVEGGFTQADHGRATHIRRLARGDLVVFYSPRTHMGAGDAMQQFTAIGRVVDDAPYQVEMTPTFHPWRRRLAFLPCQPAPIQPLIPDLSFIQDKQRWGFPFRRGLFEIPVEDFQRIAAAMQADIAEITKDI